MDRQGPPNRPRYQLTGGLIGLDNEKDAMMSRCLDSNEVRGAIWQVHSRTGQSVGALCAHIRRLFLLFGGPVCANRISNCPLDRVLTYKILIYLLNFQFCDLDLQFQGHWWPLKGQILAIFSHFGPVLIYRKLDHPMVGIYNTYI